jgi:hypothetical protein
LEAKAPREPRCARTTLVVCTAVLLFGLGHGAGVFAGVMVRELFVYDFRFYSMLLVGGLMIVPSVVGLRQLPGLRRGQLSAWHNARRVAFVLLAANLPMLPMQRGRAFVVFGALVASLAAGLLIDLTLCRRQFEGPAA